MGFKITCRNCGITAKNYKMKILAVDEEKAWETYQCITCKHCIYIEL